MAIIITVECDECNDEIGRYECDGVDEASQCALGIDEARFCSVECESEWKAYRDEDDE